MTDRQTGGHMHRRIDGHSYVDSAVDTDSEYMQFVWYVMPFSTSYIHFWLTQCYGIKTVQLVLHKLYY